MKINVVCIFKGVLFSHKEQNVVYRKMNETRDHYEIQ